MALKTIQDYERAGIADAKDPDGPVRFKRSATSWQAQYYWRGYESIAPADGAETRGAIRIEQMPANTAGWPKAAAEHARLLALDINTCRSPARRGRLYRALGRMQKRHGAQQVTA